MTATREQLGSPKPHRNCLERVSSNFAGCSWNYDACRTVQPPWTWRGTFSFEGWLLTASYYDTLGGHMRPTGGDYASLPGNLRR